MVRVPAKGKRYRVKRTESTAHTHQSKKRTHAYDYGRTCTDQNRIALERQRQIKRATKRKTHSVRRILEETQHKNTSATLENNKLQKRQSKKLTVVCAALVTAAALAVCVCGCVCAAVAVVVVVCACVCALVVVVVCAFVGVCGVVVDVVAGAELETETGTDAATTGAAAWRGVPGDDTLSAKRQQNDNKS